MPSKSSFHSNAPVTAAHCKVECLYTRRRVGLERGANLDHLDRGKHVTCLSLSAGDCGKVTKQPSSHLATILVFGRLEGVKLHAPASRP